MKDSYLVAAILYLGFAIVLSFLLSYPLMLLWNGCLVPAAPALNEVTWLQMWGIIILTKGMVKSSIKESK